MIRFAAAWPGRAGRTDRPRTGWSRAAALPLAVLAVHQLRYKLAFGSGSSHELAITGHAYLGETVPWIVLAALFAVVAGLSRLRSRDDTPVGPATAAWSPARRWLALSATLVALFVGQELVESVLASGHPAGLAGVFGDGGWWAIPAAMAVSAALVLVLRGEHALACALRRSAPLAVGRHRAPAARPWTHVRTVTACVLASSAAGRAPPAAPASGC